MVENKSEVEQNQNPLGLTPKEIRVARKIAGYLAGESDKPIKALVENGPNWAKVGKLLEPYGLNMHTQASEDDLGRIFMRVDVGFSTEPDGAVRESIVNGLTRQITLAEDALKAQNSLQSSETQGRPKTPAEIAFDELMKGSDILDKIMKGPNTFDDLMKKAPEDPLDFLKKKD